MKQKRLAYSTIIYFVLSFLPIASSFLLTPIYAQYLSPSEYGILAIANIVQGYLSIFLTLGIDGAFTRFYFAVRTDKRETDSLLSTSLISILVFSLLTAILLQLAGEPLMTAFINIPGITISNFIQPILLTTSLSMCYVVFCAFYRDSENIKSFAVIALVYFILMTSCSFYGVVILHKGVQGSIYGKLVGTLLTMSFFLPNFFVRNGLRFNSGLIKKMLSYGFPILIYGLLALLFETMDRIFIKKYYTLNDLGIYNFAFIITSVIGVVITSLQSAFNPVIYKNLLDISAENEPALNQIMKRFILTALLFASICLTISYFFILFLINKTYNASLYFIPILALSFIPRAYYIIYSYPLFTHNKTKILPLINGLSIIFGIIANYILMPVLGIYGIAISVVIIKTSQALAALFFIKRLNLYNDGVYNMTEINLASRLFFIFIIIYTCLIPYYNLDLLVFFIPLPLMTIFYLRNDTIVAQKLKRILNIN